MRWSDENGNYSQELIDFMREQAAPYVAATRRMTAIGCQLKAAEDYRRAQVFRDRGWRGMAKTMQERAALWSRDARYWMGLEDLPTEEGP